MRSGKIVELDVLGSGRAWWDGEYVGYSRAMDLCEKHNPWPATRPAHQGARTLREAVARKLRSFGYKGQLELFSAIGGPLDEKHGVDGFFRFSGRVEVTVTFDVTTNTEKIEEGHKADLILGFQNLTSGEFVAAAEQVAGFIRSKLEGRRRLSRAFEGIHFG